MSQGKKGLSSLREDQQTDWRTLAEQASHEMDTRKLLDLVQRLCEELDKHSSGGNGNTHAPAKRAASVPPGISELPARRTD